MISLRQPQRSPHVRFLARGLIGLLVLAGTPLEVWAARFDPPLSAPKTSMGNRETATDDSGITTYTYDNRNRLETLTYPDGRKLTYGYDANGNRTSLTAEVGGQVLTTTYSYDELNRLQTVTDSEGRDYVHEYDPNGNRAKLTYPNSTETSYVYDDLNRLTNLTTINTATLGMIQSYQFTLGAAGNRERIDEHDGTARAYTYDDLYRLEKETVSDLVGLVYEKSFVYDPVGNRESQTTVGTGAPGTPLAPGTIDYTYDDRDRILTEGTQSYGWDENGNLVSKDAEASYTWDFESRLTRVEKTNGTVVTHAYDPDGNRVRTETTPWTGSPEVTEFLVDTTGSLSHVIVESTGSGTITAYYVRGEDLLSVTRPNGTRYFHTDGVGSIRRLTSETGAITDGYTYSAFGERFGRTGTDPQPYAFAGEPLNVESDFQYHRARWMDPEVGRFLGLDPHPGKVNEPSSLHRYLYAAVDPLNRVDPTGRLPWFIVARFVGNEVHEQIGADFAARRPGAFVNRFSIHTVLGIPRRGCTPFPALCDRQPDLADGQAELTPEVYEIKARGRFGLGATSGAADLVLNLFLLSSNEPTGRSWSVGTSYIPPRVLYVPSNGGWLVTVDPPRAGLILYDAASFPVTIATVAAIAIAASQTRGAALGTAVGGRLALGGALP